jgi:hypothetical protein
VNTDEQNNGESLSQPVRPKARRHNAKRCQLATRQSIIYTLAKDNSISSITRNFHVSRHTVYAIREQDWQAVMNRRERILDAVQAWQNRANALLSKTDISPHELIKISGMSTDILIMLQNGLPLGTQINMRKLKEFFPLFPKP